MGRAGRGVLGRWPGELPLSTKPREDPAAGIQGKGVGPGRRLGSGRDTGGMSRVTLDEAGQPARLEEKQAEDNLKGLKSLEASRRWKEPHREWQEAPRGRATPVPSPSRRRPSVDRKELQAEGRGPEKMKAACLGPRGARPSGFREQTDRCLSIPSSWAL